MTSYASILTITAFTVERYVAICHPIKAQTLSNLSRAMKTVFVIWVLSCTFALPYPIHTRVFPYVSINGTGIAESLQCNIPFEWQTRMTYAFQISTFLFFVFPMVIISVMYGIIGYKLRRSQLESKHKSKIRARKAVVRMLGKCYLPLCQPVKGFHSPLFYWRCTEKILVWVWSWIQCKLWHIRFLEIVFDLLIFLRAWRPPLNCKNSIYPIFYFGVY